MGALPTLRQLQLWTRSYANRTANTDTDTITSKYLVAARIRTHTNTKIMSLCVRLREQKIITKITNTHAVQTQNQHNRYRYRDTITSRSPTHIFPCRIEGTVHYRVRGLVLRCRRRILYFHVAHIKYFL